MTREEAIKIIEQHEDFGDYLYAYSPRNTAADTRYAFERRTIFARELIRTATKINKEKGNTP